MQKIVDQILTSGHAQHATLGISGESLQDIPQNYWPNVPVNYGVWVYAPDNTQAKAAGFRHDDVIVAVNGHKVTGIGSLQTILQQYQPGQTVSITVYRSQQKLTLHDTLSNLPPKVTNQCGRSCDWLSVVRTKTQLPYDDWVFHANRTILCSA